MRSFSRALFSVWLLAGLFLTAGCASFGFYTNYEMKTDYVGKESYNAELFEDNYREVIKKETVSIVVYYRNNRPGIRPVFGNGCICGRRQGQPGARLCHRH